MSEERNNAAPAELDCFTEQEIVDYLKGETTIDGDRIATAEALTDADLREIEASELGSVSAMLEAVTRAAAEQVLDENGISPQDLISNDRMEQFLKGEITLADLEGMDVETAYGLAEIGNAFAQQGHVEDARTIFEALEIYNPLDPYFRVALGALYHSVGENDAAKGQLQAALSLDPNDIDAHAYLGDVLVTFGDLESATRHYAEAVRLDDSREHPSAYRAAGAITIIDAVVNEPAQPAP